MNTTKKKEELEQQQSQTVPAQSSAVQQAQNTLMQLSGRNYQSQWQPQINTMMDQYLNRDKFSYDVNEDALYQQLRDQYRLMGQTAMMDTMGQAAMLTGGYGNSYAQGVGQQAYQGFMQQLNDQIPDLYQMALNQYMNEGDQMLDKMSLLMQQDSLDYGKYRDQMADQDAAFEKLLGLMTEYGYKPTEEELAYAGLTDAQYRAIMGLPDPSAASSGGGGSSGSVKRGSGGSLNYDTHGYTVEEIKAMQEAAGITVDGIWGPNTQNAYNSGFRPDSGGGNNDITYSDVALSAAQLKQAGATKQEINEYISDKVQSSTYKPTTSVSQDMKELKAGYVGSGR